MTAMDQFKKQNPSQGLRVPPQSIDAEMALLGSVMLRPDGMNDIIDFIAPSVFYATKHKQIFEVMLELFNQRNPIDLLSVSARLKERGQLEQIGGNSYLTKVINSVPSAANIKYYGEIVHKKYMMRRLIDASDFISTIGFDEAHDLEEALDKAEKKIFEVTNQTSSKAAFVAIKDELGEALTQIARLQDTADELRGVPTGFKSLDNMLSGLQKSDLIILAARPSVGKTTFALDMARRAAIDHNIPVGIFSLEMSTQQLISRMLAAESFVDAWKIRTGRNFGKDEEGKSEISKLHEAADRLSKAPIYIDDQPGNNIIKMRSVARRLKSEHGLGLIVVDYLQLMMPTQSKNNDNVVQQVTEISRSLKNLARELDVPVLALSQLSRAVEQRGGKPRLSDLRDSGSIEQDADVVMFIHREDKNKEESERTNIAEILIEKHRNGPTGKVDLFFNSKRTTFQELPRSDFGDFEGLTVDPGAGF